VKAKAIVDNTVLTNFALINREDILMEVFEGSLFISETVFSELRQGEERGVLPERDWSWLGVLRVESEKEQHTFELLRQKFGAGESSCLSLAINRNMSVLTDDFDARRYAQRIGIPVSGTIGVLVIAVKKNIILLEKGNGFRLFSQLLR